MNIKTLISTALLAFSMQSVHAGDHGSHHTVAPASQNIVEIAAANDNFKTLTAAVTAAGLADTLQGDGPFTVFAPTDDAFAALPEGTTSELLDPANRGDLVALLEYHILPGNVTVGEISADAPAPATVEGRSLKLTSAEDGSVLAGDAKVVTADIKASNGVIHIVDKVLTPPAS